MTYRDNATVRAMLIEAGPAVFGESYEQRADRILAAHPAPSSARVGAEERQTRQEVIDAVNAIVQGRIDPDRLRLALDAYRDAVADAAFERGRLACVETHQ